MAMHLTDDDKKLLDGKAGSAAQLAMELLLKVGESLEAQRFIPISSAHVLGHYGSLHQAGIDFLERLVEGGGECRVLTSVDPCSVDFDRHEYFKVPQEYMEQQTRLRVAMEKLGVIPTWSCTPYHAFNVPRFGANIAWAESSAVAYANSVIGARTNRTPFGMDIAAAITGRIPESGLYLEENRASTLLFDLQLKELSDLDYHTIGAIVGSTCGPHIPAIKGIPPSVTNDNLKCLGAGAASAGSVALYHVLEVTPEARMNDPFRGKKPADVITVTKKDLQAMDERISTADDKTKVDMVTLGCPLLSPDELKQVYAKMQGRKVRPDVHFWIYLSQETYTQCQSLGLVPYLEEAGVQFSTSTCATISPVKVWGFSHVMTNSAKCGLVLPSEHNVAISYCNTDKCILTATEAN